MRLLLPSFLILMCCAYAASSDRPKFAVPAKVADQFIPAPYDSQKINGMLGERMRINLEQRLLRIDEHAILEGFQHRPGQQAWIGEHVGKYLDAGAKAWLYSGDTRLKTQMDRVARALIATQLADGYLGTYKDDQRWTSWDVWVHKYDLLGLLSYYEISSYDPALASARKIGDLLVKTFGEGPGQRDIIASSTHVGMAATSVLEPMVLLYRWTGEARYLEFCRYILRAWEQPNGPKLISSLNAKGSVYRTANAKAYEMMSDLVGLLELYRATGEEDLLKPVLIAWQDIRFKRRYLTGTASSHEHFQDDLSLRGEESDAVGEGCVTVTWLQLNWQLLRLTGGPAYADELERTVYNQLLAAQDPSNGNICYFTPLDGRKRATPGINCCVSSEPRGISMIPAMAWGRRDTGVAVNLYTPGRFETDLATLEVRTDYPVSGRVQITVKPAQEAAFPVYLRVPAWTQHFAVLAGRVYTPGPPGEYLALERTWKPGDTIQIVIDLSIHAIPGAPAYPESIAIQRGPQVLALEESLNPHIPSLDTAGPAYSSIDLIDNSQQLPITWLGKQSYSTPGESGHPLTLVPFADARSYRVWLARPK